MLTLWILLLFWYLESAGTRVRGESGTLAFVVAFNSTVERDVGFWGVWVLTVCANHFLSLSSLLWASLMDIDVANWGALPNGHRLCPAHLSQDLTIILSHTFLSDLLMDCRCTYKRARQKFFIWWHQTSEDTSMCDGQAAPLKQRKCLWYCLHYAIQNTNTNIDKCNLILHSYEWRCL